MSGWWFSPPIKLTFTISEILLKVAFNTITPSFPKYLVSRMLFIERKLWYPICCLFIYFVCVLWCFVFSALLFHVLLDTIKQNQTFKNMKVWYNNWAEVIGGLYLCVFLLIWCTVKPTLMTPLIKSLSTRAVSLFPWTNRTCNLICI